MSIEEVSPYSLSNFWRASAAKKEFAEALQHQDATIDSIKAAWEKLGQLLQKVFCEQHEGDGTLSLMNEAHTGMTSANAMGMEGKAALVWERLRVLQGLMSHLNLWMLVSTHFVATRPQSAWQFSHDTRRLICEIHEVLRSCDAICEVEDWAEAVIVAAQEDDEKEPRL